jgi:hypothetical protein
MSGFFIGRRDGEISGHRFDASKWGVGAPNSLHVEKGQTILQQGHGGRSVAEMQNKLHQLGFLKTAPDGKFGPETKAALIAFQKANGLEPDGKLGHASYAKLNADGAINAQGVKASAPAPASTAPPNATEDKAKAEFLEAQRQRGAISSELKNEPWADKGLVDRKAAAEAGQARLDRLEKSLAGLSPQMREVVQRRIDALREKYEDLKTVYWSDRGAGQANDAARWLEGQLTDALEIAGRR